MSTTVAHPSEADGESAIRPKKPSDDNQKIEGKDEGETSDPSAGDQGNQDAAPPPRESLLASAALWTRFSDGLAQLMRQARDHLRSSLPTAADGLVRMVRHPGPSAASALRSVGPVTLLGRTYPSLDAPDFLDDFHSRPWMTYRRGFPPISPSKYTSDAGWGCMLRSGQMLLASAFVLHELGRDWRIAHAVADTKSCVAYAEIVARFLDMHAAPYSIHRIALLGRQMDKQVGEWFGPNTVSQVISLFVVVDDVVLRGLVELAPVPSTFFKTTHWCECMNDGTLLYRALVNSDERTNLSVLVASDGVVYKDEARVILNTTREDGQKPSLLLLIPLRLGLDAMNPVYFPSVKQCFQMSSCVGIAGGRPNSSLFFVGTDANGDHLIYLDPHTLRPAIESHDVASYHIQDLLTFHCESVRLLPITSTDPSLVIGFYCRDVDAFDQLCRDANHHLAAGVTPLFSIQESVPVFDDGVAGVQVLSDDDDDDM